MSERVKYILSGLGFVLICFALFYFRNIVIYLLLAVVVSLVGRPILKVLSKIKLGKKHLPNWLQAALTLVVILVGFVAFFSIFAPLVAQQAKVFANLDYGSAAANLANPLENEDTWLGKINLSGDERSNSAFIAEKLQENINFGRISNLFNNLFGVLGSAFAGVFSVLFMSFFFLKDSQLLQKMVFSLTPDRYMEDVQDVMTGTKTMLTRYFVGLVIQVLIVTTVVSVGLSILGVKNAILIGFFAGLINLIPYMGPILGGIFGVLIAWTSNLDMSFTQEFLPLAGKIGIVFLVVQLVDNFIIQPVVFSNSVKAHPLEIFIVILIGGTIAGVLGMLLAIPVYTFVRIVAKEFLSGFKLVQNLTKNM